MQTQDVDWPMGRGLCRASPPSACQHSVCAIADDYGRSPVTTTPQLCGI